MRTSRTSPPSTAEALKFPSIVPGHINPNLIFGCSIDSALKSINEEAFEEQYRVLVGAGIIAATEEMRPMAGATEDD